MTAAHAFERLFEGKPHALTCVDMVAAAHGPRCLATANVGGCLENSEADHTRAGYTNKLTQIDEARMSGQDLDEEVTLSDYNPAWPGTASKLARQVADLLREFDAQVEHIGSTAVPGLEAKPVIDLLVGVQNQEGRRGSKFASG